MDRPLWAPAGIDIDRPSVARIYDYHLGGAHNFEADRAVAEQIAQIMPELPLIMRANRAFLARVVRLLVDTGIRRFLDLGSGIPTVGNVHEICQDVAPESRILYVDVDPVAVGHSQVLLSANDRADALQADLRDVPAVLADPRIADLVSGPEPVAVLMVAVLHFVPDSDDPAGIVRRYLDAVPPGSYLVISHAAASEDEQAPSGADAAAKQYSQSVAQATLRTRAQVAAMFDGLELLDPGVVYVNQWRPVEQGQRHLAQLVAVGRKPLT